MHVVPDARDIINQEWKEKTKADRLEVFKKIEREKLAAEMEDIDQVLLDADKRFQYMEEQTDTFQRLVRIP
jgi:hypothetical protein